MSGVKRFNMTGMWDYEENSSGRWVESSDYDRLEQECERLKSIYEEDTRRLTGVNALADDLKAERDELRVQVEAMRTAIDAVMTMDVRGHHLQDRLQFSTEGRDILEKVNAALQAKP